MADATVKSVSISTDKKLTEKVDKVPIKYGESIITEEHWYSIILASKITEKQLLEVLGVSDARK